MPKCRATTKRHGEPQQCSSWAMQGQEVCRVHGGAIQRNKDAAQRRITDEKARALLEDQPFWNLDATPTTDPMSEIAMLSGQLRDLRDKLGAQMQTQDECPCCGRGDYDHVTTSMFKTVVKESSNLLANMARLGFEKQRIELEDKKWDLLLLLLQAGLAAVGIDENDEARLITARAAVLRRAAELDAAQDIVPGVLA